MKESMDSNWMFPTQQQALFPHLIKPPRFPPSSCGLIKLLWILCLQIPPPPPWSHPRFITSPTFQAPRNISLRALVSPIAASQPRTLQSNRTSFLSMLSRTQPLILVSPFRPCSCIDLPNYHLLIMYLITSLGTQRFQAQSRWNRSHINVCLIMSCQAHVYYKTQLTSLIFITYLGVKSLCSTLSSPLVPHLSLVNGFVLRLSNIWYRCLLYLTKTIFLVSSLHQ